MSFVRIKVIKGRQYKYLVENKWTNGRAVQKVLKYIGPVEPLRTLPKKRKRVPEINLEDIQALSPWEKVFLATAIVVKERTDEVVTDEVCDLAGEYCDKVGIKQPATWDEVVDYFKTLGWIEARAGNLKFLLPKSKLKEIKKVVAGEPEIRGKEILHVEKEKIRRAVIDF